MKRIAISVLLAMTPLAASGQHGHSMAPPQGVSRAAVIDRFSEAFVEQDASFTAARRAEARDALHALRRSADSMTAAAFELELARIGALADNGHSGVLPISLAAPRAQLGVRFLLADDGLHIADARPEYEPLVGARVERIAGAELQQLRAAWSRYVPGPDSHRDESLTFFLETPALLHAAGIAPDSTGVVLKLADGRDVVVGAVGRWAEGDSIWHFLSQPPALALARAGRLRTTPLYLDEPDAFFRMVPLPDRDAVYLQFRANADFSGRTDLAQVARAAIDSLRALSPRFVIVDQRFNVGGDLNNTRSLMQAIPEIVGGNGRVFAITSGRTFSAGIASMGYLKQAAGERLTIVGAPVGDDLEFYAEGDLLVLPNGTLVMTATERHNYMTGCPEDDCHGPIRANPIRIDTLEPDIRPRFEYDDVVAGRDPWLEEILARIDDLRRPAL